MAKSKDNSAKSSSKKASSKKSAAGKSGSAKKVRTTKKKSSAAQAKDNSAANDSSAQKSSRAKSDNKSASRGKILPKQFMLDLAGAIKEAVEPAIHNVKGRDVVGEATSGDVTFELDRIAERALFSFLKSAKLPVAYYSEDTGYTTFSNAQPENLLLVDPIDGTRAAKSGFESCVVTIGSTRVIERPRVADLENACVVELLGERSFYAERGKGTRIYVNGRNKRPKLSENVDLEMMSWAMTVPARPAELIFPTAARLIDLSSLKGGFFACNSTAFSLTRLITNQLDACIDIANRYYRDAKDVVEDHFINAGRGTVLGIAPYDFAAAMLIVQEAGGVVTDAYGNTFDDILLLDSSVANQCSLIAAANAELHDKLLTFFTTRIEQYEDLLKRSSS